MLTEKMYIIEFAVNKTNSRSDKKRQRDMCLVASSGLVRNYYDMKCNLFWRSCALWDARLMQSDVAHLRLNQ